MARLGRGCAVSDALAKQVAKLEADLAEEKYEYDNVVRQLEAAETKWRSEMRTADALRAEVTRLEAEREQLQDAVVFYRSEADALRAEVAEADREATWISETADNSIRKQSSQIDALTKRVAELKAERDGLREALRRIRDDMRRAGDFVTADVADAALAKVGGDK